jgi:DNA-binding NarL/FixJ family response regulator
MAAIQESPHFVEYVALLKQLRALISGGKGESEEADHLRDRMDEPWLHLTQDEIARIDALAAEIEVPLTQRESEVLRQLAQGLTNREIAVALDVSYETVKEQVQDILRKIGVSDQEGAATWAVRKQLV